MTPGAGPRPANVEAIAAVVDRAAALGEALAMMAALVPFDVVRVSVRRRVDPDTLVISGVWSLVPTALSAGTRIPARATVIADPGIREGSPIVSSATEDAPLVDRILDDEGIASWVTIPLHDSSERLAGLLSFSSGRREGFGPGDVSFFAALGRATQQKLLALAVASDTL